MSPSFLALTLRRGVVRRMIECTNGRGHSLNGSLDHPGLVTTRGRCPHALIDARILDQVWVGGGTTSGESNRHDCGKADGWRP